MKDLTNCPDCGSILHKGQHRYDDGLYFVFFCKECGFKKELPLYDNDKIRHIKGK